MAGVAAYFGKGTMPTEYTATQGNQKEMTPTAESPTPTVAGVYMDYSPQAVADTKGVRLLFFYASWCPQCRALDQSIKETVLPAGVTIFKVDYDSNQALRQRYGVTLQTTLVKIDADGNKVKSYVTYDEPSYATIARELLP